MNTAPKKLDVQNINEECEAQAHHAMRFWNNFKVRTKVQSPKYFGVHFWLLVTDGVFVVTSGFWYAHSLSLSLSLISLELSLRSGMSSKTLHKSIAYVRAKRPVRSLVPGVA